MASRKSSKFLAKELGQFALLVKQPVEDQVAPSKAVLKVFRDAFARGGLDEVDTLIDSINKQLRKDGALTGLADGCACEHGEDGSPKYLCIMFKDYEARNPFFQQWIELN